MTWQGTRHRLREFTTCWWLKKIFKCPQKVVNNRKIRFEITKLLKILIQFGLNVSSPRILILKFVLGFTCDRIYLQLFLVLERKGVLSHWRSDLAVNLGGRPHSHVERGHQLRFHVIDRDDLHRRRPQRGYWRHWPRWYYLGHGVDMVLGLLFTYLHLARVVHSIYGRRKQWRAKKAVSKTFKITIKFKN